MTKRYLGLDVGGSSIKTGIVDGEGQMLERGRLPIPKSYEGFEAALLEQVELARRKHGVLGVGISSCGGINPYTGEVFAKIAPSLQYLIGKNYYSLREKAGLPLYVEKDGNCAALGEIWTGSAKDLRNFVTLVLGSGLGGAVAIGGRIHEGANFLAGDVGYAFPLRDSGSYSPLIAPVAIENAYQAETGRRLTIPEMKDCYGRDAAARKYYDQFMYELANVLLTMQYIIDPEMFLLGGGISAWPELVPELERHILELVRTRDCGPLVPKVRACTHHNDANILGAVYNLLLRM